jgi:ketosteroid isomerase-like protein
MIRSVEVREILVDGERACALTRYQLQPPGGAPFEGDVAEIFTVQDGRIGTFDIYFDSAPYPKS